MEYKTKRISEEIDLICLTPEEHDKINKFYKDIMTSRNPTLAKASQIFPVRRMIISDDISRIEVLVAVDDKVVPPPPIDFGL